MLATSLGLMLAAGPVGVCAAATPTGARMACCTDSDTCPMHDSGARGSGSHHQPSQAQADQCCVASDRDTPHQSMPMSVGVLSTPLLHASILLPRHVPALVRTDAWRTTSPRLVTPIPRHLLLAVFLV